jgi:peptidoglycan/xylan/chitin deacetylase (PgdA/CDA1 family)
MGRLRGGRVRGSTIVMLVALVAALTPAIPAAAVTACSRGTIALTFDDGPHATYTPKILDVLRGRRALATFFVLGSRVERNPAIARRLHAEGHRVANHTWNHENLPRLSSSAIRDTLLRTNRRLRSEGIPTPTLMRPPYGATNARVRAVASDLGLSQVLWTVDPQDWRTGRSSSTITRDVLGALRDGSIVLLHDGVGNSGATATALPAIIDGARTQGYCIGTLGSTGRVRPPVPSARIDDVQVTEGAAGTTTNARLTVTLSEPTSRTVSLAYTTVGGTAKAGRDFTASSGTVSFAVGQRSRTISVRVRGDDLDEFTERFEVRLSAPSGATIARGRGTVTILDDDPPPRLSVRDASVTEGAAGTRTSVRVPVRLSSPSGKTVTVRYATVAGTAAVGTDHLAASGTLTFSPGSTLRYADVVIVGDDLDEATETFQVRLSDPTRATIERGTATVSILDDDPRPAVGADDAAVEEGAAGTARAVQIPVRLSAPSGRTVTVGFTTVDGTAAAGDDYVATSGTLTFAAGVAVTYVSVTVLGDDVHEGDEAFRISLRDPTRATLGRATATVTIVDDDPPPGPVVDDPSSEAPTAASTQE